MDTQRAFAAGLFEGEGHLMITRNSSNASTYLYVQITSVDRDMLEFLMHHWTGSISKRKKCKEGWNDSYVWTVASRKAAAFLFDIQPYLITERNMLRARYK